MRNISSSPSSGGKGTKTFLPCHTSGFQKHQQIVSAPEPPKSSQAPPGSSSHIPAPSDGEGCDGSCEMRCLCCHCDLTTSKWVPDPIFSASPWLHTTTLIAVRPCQGLDAVSSSCPQPPSRALHSQGAISTDVGGRISSRYPVK